MISKDSPQSSSKTPASPIQRRWHDRILAARSDVAELERLDQGLQRVHEPWARALRMQAIQFQAVAKSLKWAAPLPKQAQPLYRRRLSGIEFETLQTRLRLRVGLSGLSKLDPSEVVLWGAEWFRRGYAGGPMRWDDLNAALGWRLDQAEWRDLVDQGFASWRLKPLRIGGVTYRLRSLAQQGGFPVAALKDGSAGAPCAFLERLVAALLSEQIVQIGPALSYAEALADSLPQTWRGEHFLLLGADLAVAIVRLREEAAQGGGLGAAAPSAWLDVNRPGWRADLPLSVDEDGARQLVDTLMRVVPARGFLKPVRATRLLVRLDIGWQERVRFDLAGTLALPDVRSNEWSRLRLFAAGALARYISGELGAIERYDKGWLSSPSTTGAKQHPVPFTCGIDIEARGAGRRIAGPLTLTNGQPVDGPFLTCRADDDAVTLVDDDTPPRQLVLLGTSGGSFQADPVFVLADANWTAQSLNGSAEVVDRVADKVLWRLSGEAILRGSEGDRYKVKTGCPTDVLPSFDLFPRRPGGAQVQSTGIILSWGKPDLHLRSSNRFHHPGAFAWRPVGGSDWRPAASFSGLGPCEFGLRDPGDGFWLHRQKCIILPEAFQVAAERRREATLVYVENWPGTHHVDGADRNGDAWLLPIDGRGRTEVSIRLFKAGIQPTVLQLRLPQRAVIANWAGDMIAPRSRIGLADLGEFVARSDGASILHAMLRDGSGRPVSQAGMQWHVGDVLPLGSIRADIAALLRPLGELDALVDLQFTDSDRIWNVSEFSSPAPCSLTALLGEARPGDRLIARAIQNPVVEVDISPPGLGTNESRDVVPLRQGCSLVFLRRGSRVASRPRVEVTTGIERVPSGPLGAAMTLTLHAERQTALEALCDEAGGDSVEASNRTETVLSDLISLAGSLDGLPPSTFDVLTRLPHYPRVLTRMLFAARDEQVVPLLALADGLPFAWPLIPSFYWAEAGDRMGRLILDQLGSSMPITDSLPVAARIVTYRKHTIAAAEPTLAPLLGVVLGSRPKNPLLADAMMAFMRENYDEEQIGSSPFRPNMYTLLPDVSRFDSRFWRALDAPCATAVAAARRLHLSPMQIRCVKDIHRRYPSYFEQAFTAYWHESSLAQS